MSSEGMFRSRIQRCSPSYKLTSNPAYAKLTFTSAVASPLPFDVVPAKESLKLAFGSSTLVCPPMTTRPVMEMLPQRVSNTDGSSS